MSLGSHPKPDAEEFVVWRHTSPMETQTNVLQKMTKAPPAWFLKFGKRFYWFALVGIWVLMMTKANDQGGLSVFSIEFWLEWFQSTGLVILAAGIFAWGLGFIFKKRNVKRIVIDQVSGIPVWMSARRLVFNPSRSAPTNALDIIAIQSISTDFIMGSHALIIRTTTDTFKLISSETRSLLQHLYTLRPDLEPTS